MLHLESASCSDANCLLRLGFKRILSINYLNHSISAKVQAGKWEKYTSLFLSFTADLTIQWRQKVSTTRWSLIRDALIQLRIVSELLRQIFINAKKLYTCLTNRRRAELR